MWDAVVSTWEMPLEGQPISGKWRLKCQKIKIKKTPFLCTHGQFSALISKERGLQNEKAEKGDVSVLLLL